MSSEMPPPPVPSTPAAAATPGEASGSVDDGAPRTSQRARRPSARLEQSAEPSGSSYSLRDSLRGRKTAPRLKLNLKTAVQAGASGGTGTGPKTTPYMQGFDRELDSSDDETGQGLAFEEQLVLRMPQGEACEQLREWVRRREIGKQGAQVELKFKDSRRAVFKMGSQLFAAKLVDLPTILETHKTLDARQLFKIADISQMLLVTHQIQSEAEATRAAPPPPPPDREGSTHINADTAQTQPGAGEYVFDHGITPPMRFARKRRFRRRAHKRVIETVEKEIERLLADDRKADKVEYEMIDAAQADFSDDDEEGAARGRRGHSTAETPAPGDDGASAMGDGASMDGDDRDAAGSGMEEDWDGEGAGEVDHDLAAELEAVMRGDASDVSDEEESSMGGSARGGGSGRATSDDGDGDLWGDDDGDESGGDDEEGQDEDDLDEEEKERRVREAQLEAQCREMDALVKRKQAEAGATTNALIKKRQLDALKRLVAERDMKTSQLADVRAERRERAAEAAAAAAAAAPVAEPAGAPTTAASEEPIAAKPSEKGKEREVSSARSTSGPAPAAPAVGLALPGAAASSSVVGTAAQPMEVDDDADADADADADGDEVLEDADAPGDADADGDEDEELWS